MKPSVEMAKANLKLPPAMRSAVSVSHVSGIVPLVVNVMVTYSPWTMDSSSVVLATPVI